MKEKMTVGHDKLSKEVFGKNLSDMSDKELCAHYRELDVSINVTECYGVKDVALFAVLQNEMGKRDIDILEGESIYIGADGETIEV